jgi:hypothetical protein
MDGPPVVLSTFRHTPCAARNGTRSVPDTFVLPAHSRRRRGAVPRRARRGPYQYHNLSVWKRRIGVPFPVGRRGSSSSRRNMAPRLGSVCVPCCSALSICGVSQDWTMRATSTSLTEPDLSISDIRLFSRTHGRSDKLRVVIRAVIGDVRYSVLCPTHVSSSLCVLPPTPSSGLRCPRRTLPRLLLYYELVRLPCRHTSALPFVSLLEASFGERHGSPKFRCKPLDDLPWT